MADTATFSPSRRFVIAAIGIGAAGFAVGCDSRSADATATGPVTLTSLGDYVRIGSDNTVTVYLRHIEFGQGVSTGLTTIVAEEIDADWSQMRFEHSPADNAKYGNPAFGGMMGTGGSTAIFSSWEQLRAAGASAREMLRQAAAKKFGVDAAEVVMAKGKATAGGKSATYGELAVDAAAIPAPDAASLKYKDASAYEFIGKERAPGYGRLDSADKIHAKAQYALDYHPEGTLVALLQRSPKFGGKVASFDDTGAKAVKGVTDVVQISNGVAVVATDFWAAKKGREALKVTWDDSAAESRSSDAIFADYRKQLAKAGHEARKEGKGAAALTGAGEVVTADFEFPFLVHAPMEPLNCVVEYKPGVSATIHSGSQMPTGDQAAACAVLGLTPEQVTIVTHLAGGSFGRRATPDADLVSEATQIAKAVNGKAPIRLMWTREDDIRSGKYRPMAIHRMTARTNAGKLEAWGDRTAIQSIMEGTPFLPPGAVDTSSIEGGHDIPYAIPNIAVDVHLVKAPTSVLWWRSVGHTHTAYAKEHFFDVVAKKLGKDPVEYRRELLAGHPRLLGVLNLAAEKAGWGSPLPAGKFRGVAVHHSFSSYVAEVAEVSVATDGSFHVDRVVCAVDCGIVINPDIVRAQMEGGIGYGLSSILGEALTLKDGAPVQSNFFDYNVLRMSQMPKVEVYIVPSTEPPSGVGEPGVPPIGPAVANALFAATSKTYAKLPLGMKA